MPPSTAITELNLPVIEAASQEAKSQLLSGSASTLVINKTVPPGTGEDSKAAVQQFSMGDGLPGSDWSQPNSSLFAVTFLAQQNGRGKTC